MYLAELRIQNFRKLRDATLHFQAGLNVIVGANNVGKSAVVDALRALLAGQDEPFPRLTIDDRHRPRGEDAQGNIYFQYIFRGLTLDEEADFLAALTPDEAGRLEAHVHVQYGDADQTGRFKAKRWCGVHEEVPLTADMMENLRGVYLQPLRDASQSLRPSRNSQLSRLLHLLTDEDGRLQINVALGVLDQQIRAHAPILNTQTAISTRHDAMLGDQLRQELLVGLSSNDFQRLSSRLSLSVDNFEIEQNGLGFNNLIFMAVVLSELAKNVDATYRGLIVEEPEAHLHPQLQAILLKYLASLHAVEGEKPVQLFVTSHSPNFASNANLDCLSCLVETDGNVETFFPRKIDFRPGKREKLARYLDVTRAELFFARKVIFVEGAAELMLVDALATAANIDFRRHGVSLISVEGLNFDSFLPLFGINALKIPVALITDADPDPVVGADGNSQAVYPSLGDQVNVSANTTNMLAHEDQFVQVFHGVKTLEYDLALYAENREAMLTALDEMHPQIAAVVRLEVDAAADNTDKARILFTRLFERPPSQKNVQKGRFGQALAAVIAGGAPCRVPDYIGQALLHVCPAGVR
ncbi:ATP-dependent nuclease [Herbaspirillum sp. NPDC101396]|uniref:ATP-dependent nuclease n=1 Tax=Herbaspirillum sp. NPDC101396 TaxID=3364005 RepID=UPI00383B085E